MRGILYPFVDLLAGIPSDHLWIYRTGNFGKIFYSGGNSDRFLCSGSRDFAGNYAAPFLVSSCSETMLKVKEEYLPCAEAMGISRWYAIATIVLPASWKNIMMSMILAIGRAMGETMAVMMVIGNANLFPHLLGKSESIASVIALENGNSSCGKHTLPCTVCSRNGSDDSVVCNKYDYYHTSGKLIG